MIDMIINIVTPILALASILVFAAIFARVMTSLWYRLSQRGRLPLIVHDIDVGQTPEPIQSDTIVNEEDVASPFEGVAGREDYRSLTAMLRAYIAEDVQGARLVAPGSANIVTPTIPAETPSSTEGWLSTVILLAAAGQPAYHVMMDRLPTPDGYKVAVQLVRRPGNRIVAAQSFHARTSSDLVSAVGGYCVQHVQQQKHALRRTPRWEHWANRGGYQVFRDALANQLEASVIDVDALTSKAILGYERAGRKSLGNVTVVLRRAGIYEQKRDYLGAIEIYRYCHQLWPESIETTYRYAAACSNARSASVGNSTDASLLLNEIQAALSIPCLFRRWALTWFPNRWNVGERSYWFSWLRPWRSPYIPIICRRSKRRDFLSAVAIGREVVVVASAVGKPIPERMRPTEVASSVERVRTYASRRRIGWLAHYNAACFYALCLKLGRDSIPSEEGEVDSWRRHCIDAALHELARVLRDPFNKLDPEWMQVDPDLQALRHAPEVQGWANFIGISLDHPHDETLAGPARVRDFV